MFYHFKNQKQSALWPPYTQAEIHFSWSKFYAEFILCLTKVVKYLSKTHSDTLYQSY